MPTNRRVSVLIPTHNRKDLLRQAVASVLTQTGVDVEVVVIDNGSTDGTREMFAEVDDPRIVYLHDPNPIGPSAARNLGLEVATGDWIANLDDDDLWMADKCESQFRAIDATFGAGWVASSSAMFDRTAHVVSIDPAPDQDAFVELLPAYNVVPGSASCVMMRRDLAIPYDPLTDGVEDWDLWLHLLEQTAPALAPEPTVCIRFHGNQFSADPTPIEGPIEIMVEKHRALYEEVGLKPVFPLAYGNEAAWLLRTGRPRPALRRAGKAVTEAARTRSFHRAGQLGMWVVRSVQGEIALRRGSAELDQMTIDLRARMVELDLVAEAIFGPIPMSSAASAA